LYFVSRTATALTEKICPNCKASVPVHPGYVSWCDGCGWNLSPRTAADAAGIADRIKLALGERFSEDLYRKVSAGGVLKPSLTLSKIAVLGLALLVHAVTAILVVLGIGLIGWGWPNIMAIAGGLFSLGLAWALRPRFRGSRPIVLPRQEYPVFYELVDAVTASVGLRNLEGIAVDDSFNARYTEVGFRRRKIITIGLPFFSVLGPLERVGLLAHEAAHGANGDISRLVFIGGAVSSLISWYKLLRPKGLFSSESGMPGIVMFPMNLVMMGLAGIAYGGAYAINLLLYRDSQRAEYLADVLATTACGKEAMLRQLETIHYSDMFDMAVQRAALNQENRDLYGELRRQIAAAPPREIERIRRIERMRGSRLDATHPPTPYRISFIELQGSSSPGVDFSESASAELDRELADLYRQANRMALESYERSLYR
jgi:Zn-dependent protease with chaperone function